MSPLPWLHEKLHLLQQNILKWNSLVFHTCLLVEHYIAAWRYEISLLVFGTSPWLCNILYVCLVFLRIPWAERRQKGRKSWKWSLHQKRMITFTWRKTLAKLLSLAFEETENLSMQSTIASEVISERKKGMVIKIFYLSFGNLNLEGYNYCQSLNYKEKV